jgi:hypothetical protein
MTRAMRSVLYSAYQVHSLPIVTSLSTRAPFKAALNALAAEERTLKDLGA